MLAVTQPKVSRGTRKVSRFAARNAEDKAAGTQVLYDHPKTFMEFYEREGKVVKNWLRGNNCPSDLIEDYEHDIFVFLMKPVTNKQNVTFQDHIAYYQPELMGNFRTRPAFLHHVFGMLKTEYPKIIRRWNRPRVSGESVVSLSLGEEGFMRLSQVHQGTVKPEEGEVRITPLMTSDDTNLFSMAPEDCTSKVIVDTFFTYLDRVAEPDVVAYARAIRAFDTLKEVDAFLGLTVARRRALTIQMQFWATKFSRACKLQTADV